jgi:hypothetical protein
MDTTYEKLLIKSIIPDLKNGRSDFDLNHTLAVIHWIKYILSTEAKHLDSKVMITAAYAHDWGYFGLFDNTDSNSISDINKQKELHMKNGSKKIRYLLNQYPSLFSKEQVGQISNLVGIHDSVELLETDEEITLMEADTLGALDIDRVKPTFSKEDNLQYIDEQIYKRRLKKFIHKEVVKIATKLAKKRLDYYL